MSFLQFSDEPQVSYRIKNIPPIFKMSEFGIILLPQDILYIENDKNFFPE